MEPGSHYSRGTGRWSAHMKTSLQAVTTDHLVAAPYSYDECVERLAHSIDHHDDAGLEEVAQLIGRLGVGIEEMGRFPQKSAGPNPPMAAKPGPPARRAQRMPHHGGGRRDHRLAGIVFQQFYRVER